MLHAQTIPVNDQISLFEELKDHLAGYNIKSVSDLSGVATPTLYFWLDGTTRKPRLDTIIKVAQALGYELQLIKTTKRKNYLTLVK